MPRRERDRDPRFQTREGLNLRAIQLPSFLFRISLARPAIRDSGLAAASNPGSNPLALPGTDDLPLPRLFALRGGP